MRTAVRHAWACLAALALLAAAATAHATTIPKPIALFETSLATSISASDTSISLVSATDKDGNALATAQYAFIIDEGTSAEEFVLATCTGTSCTNAQRGISVVTGTSTVSALQKAHRRGASVKITDAPIILTLSRILNGEGTIPNFVSYAGYATPTASTTLTSKGYVDNMAATASTSAASLYNALDAQNVKITGTQTVGGDKTITGTTVISGATTISGTLAATASTTFSVPAVQATQPYASTQLANKAYVDGVAFAGVNNADTATKGIVEEATSAEVLAGGTTGSTAARLYVNPNQLYAVSASSTAGAADANEFVRLNSSGVLDSSFYGAPITTVPTTQVYTSAMTGVGDSTTRFDVTNPAGTTFRYTFDGTGTDPLIDGTTFPTGVAVLVQGNFHTSNSGVFAVTGSGSNYFEVTNASGVVEADKTIGNGIVTKGATWTKPANLKYVVVEGCGGGAKGGDASTSGSSDAASGGAAGGCARKLIAASSLGATENVFTGRGETASVSAAQAAFGTHVKMLPSGGTPTGGDVNVIGQPGGQPAADQQSGALSGDGGNTWYGWGGRGLINEANGNDGQGYGSGGGGAWETGAGGATTGGSGAGGIVIVREFYI